MMFGFQDCFLIEGIVFGQIEFVMDYVIVCNCVVVDFDVFDIGVFVLVNQVIYRNCVVIDFVVVVWGYVGKRIVGRSDLF